MGPCPSTSGGRPTVTTRVSHRVIGPPFPAGSTTAPGASSTGWTTSHVGDVVTSARTGGPSMFLSPSSKSGKGSYDPRESFIGIWKEKERKEWWGDREKVGGVGRREGNLWYVSYKSSDRDLVFWKGRDGESSTHSNPFSELERLRVKRWLVYHHSYGGIHLSHDFICSIVDILRVNRVAHRG